MPEAIRPGVLGMYSTGAHTVFVFPPSSSQNGCNDAFLYVALDNATGSRRAGTMHGKALPGGISQMGLASTYDPVNDSIWMFQATGQRYVGSETGHGRGTEAGWTWVSSG